MSAAYADYLPPEPREIGRVFCAGVEVRRQPELGTGQSKMIKDRPQ